MISFILGLVLFGILLYTAMIYISPALTLLALMLAVLLVWSQVCLFLRRRVLRCQVDVPVPSASREKPVRVRLRIDKRGNLPMQRWKLLLLVQNSFSGKRRRVWIGGDVLSPGKNVFEDEILLGNYGKYILSARTLIFYDLTGLFYRKMAVRSVQNVLVLPDFESVGIRLTESTRNFLGDAEVYDGERPGPDNSETFQIRPFQDGDKLQSVHWKLSVKMDDLVVRENSLPKACPVVLFLDFASGARGRRGSRAELADAYLAVMVSLSFSMMDAGCAHYAAWHSGEEELMRLRVDDEESLYLFLSRYMEERFTDRLPEPEKVYEDKYRGERYLHFFRLVNTDEELELWRGGELLFHFGGKSWKEDLKRLELLL